MNGKGINKKEHLAGYCFPVYKSKILRVQKLLECFLFYHKHNFLRTLSCIRTYIIA